MRRYYNIDALKKTTAIDRVPSRTAIDRIKYKIIHLLDPTLFPDIDLQCFIYSTLQE